MTYIPRESSLMRFLNINLRALYRRGWQMIHPCQHSGPAFLIGAGRSGTDLLVENLSRSPQLDVYNETDPRAFENFRLRSYDTLRALVSGSLATRVLFKPIVETHRVRYFLEFGEDSRIIFATRNPWDTVNSMLRFFTKIEHMSVAWAASDPRDDYPLNATAAIRNRYLALHSPDLTLADRAALIWWVRNALFFELGLHKSEQVTAVRYRDLVEDPESTLRFLCQFLGISYQSNMSSGIFRSSRGKNPVPELQPDIHTACSSLWVRFEALV